MKTTSKMTWAGLLMGVIGIIIAIEFLAIDAQLFVIQAPQIITTLSSVIPLNGLELDMLMTIDLLLIFLEFHWQGEE